MKGKTHWKPFVPQPGSKLLHQFQERRKEVLKEISAATMGSTFDFEGLLLAATPCDSGESLIRSSQKARP